MNYLPYSPDELISAALGNAKSSRRVVNRRRPAVIDFDRMRHCIQYKPALPKAGYQLRYWAVSDCGFCSDFGTGVEVPVLPMPQVLSIVRDVGSDHLLERADSYPAMASAMPIRGAKNAALAAGTIYLAVESIDSPGNLGTMIRTAEAAGVAGIFLLGQVDDPFAPATVRASMGSLFAQKLVKCSPQEFIA